MPKPLIEVAGRALIDHCLDRFAENGVETAIVNVHWLADQIEAHLGTACDRASSSPTSAKSCSTRAARSSARARISATSRSFVCNTDAFWIEGPRSNLARLAEAFDPERMDAILLVAAGAHAVGVDWPGDFEMDADGRLSRREPHDVAPFVYTGVGIMKPQLFDGIEEDVFRLAPFFWRAAENGRLFGLRLDGLWLHVGRPEAIAEAEEAIARSVL